MVWKEIKQPTEEVIGHISRRAIKKKANPLFSHAHTRKGRELNQSENCKITTEKTLTRSQSIAYNQILDDQRMKNEPKSKSYKRKKKY